MNKLSKLSKELSKSGFINVKEIQDGIVVNAFSFIASIDQDILEIHNDGTIKFLVNDVDFAFGGKFILKTIKYALTVIEKVGY